MLLLKILAEQGIIAQSQAKVRVVHKRSNSVILSYTKPGGKMMNEG